MKAFGVLLVLVYWNSLGYQFSFGALAGLIVGLVLLFPEATKEVIKRVKL